MAEGGCSINPLGQSEGVAAMVSWWEDGHHFGIYNWHYLHSPCPICREDDLWTINISNLFFGGKVYFAHVGDVSHAVSKMDRPIQFTK
jgi:DUF971 family protein